MGIKCRGARQKRLWIVLCGKGSSNAIAQLGCLMMSSSPSSDPEPKRMCDMKTIGTHSGHFHCDEALACYMLKLLPEYKDARYMYMYMYRIAGNFRGCKIS